MALPKDVVGRVDQLLGIKGRPRRILLDGNWVDTPCYEWTERPSPADVWGSASPQLLDAIERSQEVLSADPSGDANQLLETFFADEPSEVQTEYHAFNSALRAAYDQDLELVDPKPDFPDMPAALAEANERIGARLVLEGYEDEDFDIDKWTAHSRQLWRKESSEIQQMLDKYLEEIKPMLERNQRASSRQEQKLRQIRQELSGDDVVAYGDIVVGPAADQFNILRYERTAGENYGLGTEDIVDRLMGIDREFGIDIQDASTSRVEFRLVEVPSGEDLEKLESSLLDLCPDMQESTPDLSEGRIILWWD